MSEILVKVDGGWTDDPVAIAASMAAMAATCELQAKLIAALESEIARLREERRIVPVMGEIVDMEFSSELGVYYGTIGCPKCNWEGHVSPMADRPKCRCGVEWDFSVSAAGTQPLPPGPEGVA